MADHDASMPKAFQPERYSLEVTAFAPDHLKLRLLIAGRKNDRPSKRITLHQRGIKINSAAINYERRNIIYHHDVVRINHIKSFEEVRLHSADNLYPGRYEIKLHFTSNMPLSAYEQLSKQGLQFVEDEAVFKYFPTVNKIKARDITNFEISYDDGKNGFKI